MPYEAYIGYLTDDNKEVRKEILEGEPFVIEVRDLDTFERLIVRARVAQTADALPQGDELQVLDWTEARLEDKWAIEVLEELDEEAAAAERSDIGESDLKASAEEAKKFGGKKYRGSQLPEMMGQEEARKYFENLADKTGKR